MAYTKEMIETIAIVCHEANRAFCETLGDFSQEPWRSTPDNIKASARNGVQFILANPNAGDAASHENWLKFKKEDGWTYGDVKDVDAKTHPCMVPYLTLPETQRLKDKLFRSIVVSFLCGMTDSSLYGAGLGERRFYVDLPLGEEDVKAMDAGNESLKDDSASASGSVTDAGNALAAPAAEASSTTATVESGSPPASTAASSTEKSGKKKK